MKFSLEKSDDFRELMKYKFEKKKIGLGLRIFWGPDSEKLTSHTQEPVGLSFNPK